MPRSEATRAKAAPSMLSTKGEAVGMGRHQEQSPCVGWLTVMPWQMVKPQRATCGDVA